MVDLSYIRGWTHQETSESSSSPKTVSQLGQATVEFALTMILFMAFMFFFMQLSLVFSFGNYVHYATFMSARAYLAAGKDAGDQKERAIAVAAVMLKRSIGQTGVDKFPSIAKGVGGGEIPGFTPGFGPSASEMTNNWMQGVRYTFRSKLFLMSLSGKRNDQMSQGDVTLTSESWLGREPTYSDCQGYMGSLGGSGGGGIFDNGC